MESYAAYRRSTLWQLIRTRVFDRDRSTCVLCGRVASQVHHLNYEPATIQGENDESLVALCGSCHIKIEFDGGRKRSDVAEKRTLYDEFRADRLRKLNQVEHIRQHGVEIKWSSSRNRAWQEFRFHITDAASIDQIFRIESLLWLVRCAYITRYRLHTARGAVFAKLTSKEGLPLLELPERKRVVVLLNAACFGLVRCRRVELAFPWTELKSLFSESRVTLKLQEEQPT